MIQNIPNSFICPITAEIMKEPVLCKDGHTYEKSEILKWIKDKHNSPITRQHLTENDMTDNIALRELIEEFTKTGEVPKELTITKEDNPFIETEETINNKINMTIDSTQDSKMITINTQSIQDSVPKNIVLLVDVSYSMNDTITNVENQSYNALYFVKHSLRVVVNSCNSNDYISLITFSDQSKIIQNWIQCTKTNKELLIKNIKELKVEGGTSIWNGLKTGIDLVTNLNNIRDTFIGNTNMILFTDGQNNGFTPAKGIVNELEQLKDNSNINASIYTVGYGNTSEVKLLYDISTVSNGYYSYISDVNMIGTVFVNLLANISSTIGIDAELLFSKEVEVLSDLPKLTTRYKLPIIKAGEKRHVLVKNSSNMFDYPTDFEVMLKYTSITGKVHEIKKITEVSHDNELYKMHKQRSEFVKLCKQLPNVNLFNEYLQHTHLSELTEDIQNELLKGLRDNFNTWGERYFYFFMQSHDYENCTNFKDKSLQKYIGELGKKLRNEYNSIYNNIQPWQNSNKCRSGNNTSSRNISMSRFNNSNNICYHENGKIITDKKIKKCKDIKQGDNVLTKDGFAKVKCVVKTKQINNLCYMTQLGELFITPWHPVNIDNEWKFPTEISKTTKLINTEYIYSFVLEKYHTLIVDNVITCTLGHNNKNIPYSYYSDKVIQDIEKVGGFKKGVVIVENVSRNEKTSKVEFVQFECVTN